MNQRSGISLAEVLIAMFVLTLGLLSVMSMFPLGASRMAQAIKDDRTATLNNDAGSVMRWAWKDDFQRYKSFNPNPPPGQYVYTQRTLYPNGGVNGNGAPSPNEPATYDPFVNARSNVNFSYGPWNAAANAITPASQIPNLRLIPRYAGPSYPVFVDPIGWNNSYNAGTAQQFWVGANNNYTGNSVAFSIPRRSLRRIQFQLPWNGPATAPYTGATSPTIYEVLNRYLVLQDDLAFGLDGTPVSPTGTTSGNSSSNLSQMSQQIQRTGRYNCAFMIQWPDASNGQVTEATMSVVVYSGRTVDAPISEATYNAIFTPKSTAVQIVYGNNPRPNLHKGNWILDATMAYQTGNQQLPYLPDPHGYFYRVVNVPDSDSTPGVMVIEVQTPAFNTNVTQYSNGTPYGVLVVMDGVAEVFQNRAIGLTSSSVP